MDRIIERLEAGRALVLLHGNADPDALGCGLAIKASFPDVDVAAFGGLDRVSKAVAANLSAVVLETADLDAYSFLLAVDSSSREQLGVDLGGRECAAIDHHAESGDWDGLRWIDESRRSCSEMVLELLIAAGKPIGREVALALGAGMLTDSGHFRFADAALMRSFATLLEGGGISMDEVMSLTDLEPDTSERVSQLKGAQRLRFERVGDRIAAISLGSAHESSVCKALLAIGADAVFVGSQRDERFRISARARQDLVREGLHLGRMLDAIASETSSSGGGHAGAAGIAGVGDVEAVLNMCMSRAMDFLRELKERRAVVG